MISASVAPLARFISAMTSAFLLARSALGLLDGFLARPAFFAGLILAAVRLAFACVAPGSGVVVFSVSIAFVFIVLLLTGLRSSHRSLRFGEIATRIFGD